MKTSHLVFEDLQTSINEIKTLDPDSDQFRWSTGKILYLHSMMPVVSFLESSGENIEVNQLIDLHGVLGLIDQGIKKYGTVFTILSSQLRNSLNLLPGYTEESKMQPLETITLYTAICSTMTKLKNESKKV